MEEKINNVLNYWNDNMSIMITAVSVLIKESSEAIKAISKYEKECNINEIKYLHELEKEIADVYIGLKAIMLYYEITDDKIKTEVKGKLKMLKKSKNRNYYNAYNDSDVN